MLKQRGHHKIEMGSERAFGFVFAAFFLLWGGYSLFSGGGYHWWSLGIAIAFAALALFYPVALRPLNRAWFLFGLLLGQVVAPLVITLVYVLAVAPTGILMRRLGKDPLHLKHPPSTSATFWHDRSGADRKMGSMKNQF
ncbi:MAG: hypothetical protein HY777_13250 [Betaproteobacteria bacterium]|nr:hypothetical protein [Betaproteobacteria bacterium]